MAPGYRTNAQTRRGARGGFPEHDDFEGLPVRQWRKEMLTVAPTQEHEDNKKNDRWAVELPHGMPKGSELLPPHSLALLRAARSGALYKRAPPQDDEDGDAEALPGDKAEKKASGFNEGFQVPVWKQVARNAEGPTISHLAKRHKGTVTLPSKTLATQIAGPMVTKATVKRIDAAGNPYTQEVILTEGQQVDGEIISTSVVAAPEQAGPSSSTAATPMRRKPPIPQKKKGRRGRGGRGRGRLPLQTSTRSDAQNGTGLGLDGVSEIKDEGIGPDAVKTEPDDKTGQDVEMMDSSALDEGDEGEGDGDEDEEGDGNESGTPAENDDQDMEDAPALPLSSSSADGTLASASDAPGTPLGLAPPSLNTDTSRIEGSPLKNVIIRSPIEASPHISPIAPPSSTEVGLSQVLDKPAPGLQPSLIANDSQSPPVPVSVAAEEPARESQSLEPAAPVSAETAPEETPGVVAITSTQEPEALVPPIPAQPAVSPVAVEQPPPADESTDAAPSIADVPLPTKEEPMPGQIAEPEPQPEEDISPAEPLATDPAPTELATTVPLPKVSSPKEPAPTGPVPAEPVPAEPAPTDPAPTEPAPTEPAPTEPAPTEPAPTEPAPTEPATTEPATKEPAAKEPATGDPPAPVEAPAAAHAPTEDGTDDGSDLLGPLGASLNQQAEEDAPNSAPAPPAEEPSAS